MGKKIIIFVILGFFISLIIKIEYFSVVLNLMAIATIMSLKHGRKKIKFDIFIWIRKKIFLKNYFFILASCSL